MKKNTTYFILCFTFLLIGNVVNSFGQRSKVPFYRGDIKAEKKEEVVLPQKNTLTIQVIYGKTNLPISKARINVEETDQVYETDSLGVIVFNANEEFTGFSKLHIRVWKRIYGRQYDKEMVLTILNKIDKKIIIRVTHFNITRRVDGCPSF